MSNTLKGQFCREHILPRQTIAAIAESAGGHGALGARTREHSLGVHTAAGDRDGVIDIERQVERSQHEIGECERVVDPNVTDFQEISLFDEEVGEVEPRLRLGGSLECRLWNGIVLDVLGKPELPVEGVHISPRLVVASEREVEFAPMSRDGEIAIDGGDSASEVLVVESLFHRAVGVERGGRAPEESHRLTLLDHGDDGARRESADGKRHDASCGENFVGVGIERATQAQSPFLVVDDVEILKAFKKQALEWTKNDPEMHEIAESIITSYDELEALSVKESVDKAISWGKIYDKYTEPDSEFSGDINPITAMIFNPYWSLKDHYTLFFKELPQSEDDLYDYPYINLNLYGCELCGESVHLVSWRICDDYGLHHSTLKPCLPECRFDTIELRIWSVGMCPPIVGKDRNPIGSRTIIGSGVMDCIQSLFLPPTEDICSRFNFRHLKAPPHFS